MMTERSLLLWIETNSCKCGQRWTHSYCTYAAGGTPTPADEDKLQVERILTSLRSHSHCHRCAPLGLDIGWEKPGAVGAQPPSLARSAKDMLS